MVFSFPLKVMNEIDETLSVQANLVRMVQELTNVSSYKASSLTGKHSNYIYFVTSTLANHIV